MKDKKTKKQIITFLRNNKYVHNLSSLQKKMLDDVNPLILSKKDELLKLVLDKKTLSPSILGKTIPKKSKRNLQLKLLEHFNEQYYLNEIDQLKKFVLENNRYPVPNKVLNHYENFLCEVLFNLNPKQSIKEIRPLLINGDEHHHHFSDCLNLFILKEKRLPAENSTCTYEKYLFLIYTNFKNKLHINKNLDIRRKNMILIKNKETIDLLREFIYENKRLPKSSDKSHYSLYLYLTKFKTKNSNKDPELLLNLINEFPFLENELSTCINKL